MNELNDRLKPALDWCKRRELERMRAGIAKRGVGVSPIESHHIYTLHPVLNAIHKEKSIKTLGNNINQSKLSKQDEKA